MGCSKAEVIPALSSSPIHLSHGRTDHLFLILREGTLPVVLLALLHQLDALTVVLHGVVDLVGVGVLTFISATEFLPALHTCSALAEVELLVSTLPDLRRCSITGIARVIHMAACHCPKPTSLIVEDEEAGQQAKLHATQRYQGLLVLKIPKPRGLWQSKSTLGQFDQIITAFSTKDLSNDVHSFLRVSVGNLHIDLATLWKLPTLEKSCWYILVEDLPAFLHRDEVQQIVPDHTHRRRWCRKPPKGKCWNPVKGHSSERKTQSRESVGTGTQSREPNEGKIQSRESVGTGTQSREPNEGKTQSRESAGTQSRDTQWREITAQGKFGLEEKQCFKCSKSLIYRIREILNFFKLLKLPNPFPRLRIWETV